MFADDFLHPDHVVPFLKFAAAVVKCAHGLKSFFQMKTVAVKAQMFVFAFRHRDAGVHIQHADAPQGTLQCLVKKRSDAGPAGILPDIDGHFHGPIIGFPCFESVGIGVTENFAVFHGLEVRQRRADASDPFPEFFAGGDFVFKGYRRVAYIRRIILPFDFPPFG